MEARVCFPDAVDALNQPPRVEDPLGLYIHIPFCRKRCLFCYFKVYTDKNASEIEVYLDALIKENEIYSRMPLFRDASFASRTSAAARLRTSAKSSFAISWKV